MRVTLWAIAEVTIIARYPSPSPSHPHPHLLPRPHHHPHHHPAISDIPEVVGTAFALKFLFGTPLWIGVIVTSCSVLMFLAVNYFGVRKLEMLIGSMIAVVVVCFVAELFLSPVEVTGILRGLLPSFNPAATYAATSLIGAVVMPHNLFLHSALVQVRWDIAKGMGDGDGDGAMNL